MKKLAALVLLLAAPAAFAQDSELYYASSAWPVHTSAGVCTVTQASGADGLLGIAHHGDEVVLTSTSSVESPLPETGKVYLALVFLDNGRLRHDDGWGTREFTYARSGDVYRFSTRFAGRRNVEQILADLAARRSFGMLQQGAVVFSFDLADLAPSLASLHECARGAGR